ncbi:magnesium transporter, partial [Rhizobium ruizarguesonis]
RMQTEFVAVPPFWTVGQKIDYMRDAEDLHYSFSQIFVLDPTFKLLGAVDLEQILSTKRKTKIEQIMRATNHPVPAEVDQEE